MFKVRRGSWLLALAICFSEAELVRAQADCCGPTEVLRSAWPQSRGPFSFGRVPWAGGDRLGRTCFYAVDLNGGSRGRTSFDGGTTWEDWGPWIAEPDSPVFDISPGGRLLVVHYNLGVIEAWRSIDGGRTFEPPKALGETRSFTSDGPAVVANHDLGIVAVGWKAVRTGAIQVAVSFDDGARWQPPVTVSEGGFPGYPRMALGPEGLIVAWSTTPPACAYRFSPDYGLTWDPVTPLSLGWPLTMLQPLRGVVPVLYPRLEPDGRLSLRMAVSVDGGRTFPADGETLLDDLLAGAAPDGPWWTAIRGSGTSIHVLWQAGQHVVRSSPSGLAGSWGPPVVACPGGAELERASLAIGASGELVVAHDDYRDLPGCFAGPECESVYLDTTCDGNTYTQLRLDEDVAGRGPHSEDPRLIVEDARMHVIWSEGAFNIENAALTEQFVHVALDTTPLPAPDLTAQPPDACRPTSWVLSVPSSELAGCAGAVVEWLRDGLVLPGDTEPSLLLDASTPPGLHRHAYRLTCEGRCTATSRGVDLDVTAPETTVITENARDLRVRRAATNLTLAWRHAGSAATAGSIYQGSVASLHAGRSYDHGVATCHVGRIPPGSDLVSADVPMTPNDAYYLVSAADCRGESDVGTDSRGWHRPRPAVPCGPVP